MTRCSEVGVVGLYGLKAATGLKTRWNFDRLLGLATHRLKVSLDAIHAQHVDEVWSAWQALA